jgi:hypothetical protein
LMGNHLMGNHRVQHTRYGCSPFEQGASLNLPLGPAQRGKVTLSDLRSPHTISQPDFC